MVLGVICRDQLYLVFKCLEHKKIGVLIVLLLTLKSIHRIQIVFIDDKDIFSNGEDCEMNIQQIIDIYTKLYEATGVKI